MRNNKWVRKICKHWEFTLGMILILEIVIFATKNPRFLIPRVFLGSLNDIMSICFISLFETFVMISGGIDIQAGSIVGLTSIITGVMWQDTGTSIFAAAGLATVIAALCGALSGYFIAYCKVQPMVVTLGGSFLYSGLALLVSNLSATEAYKGISGFPESFSALSRYRLFGVLPFQVIVFVIMAIVAHYLLNKTKYGRKVFLVGVNKNAAEYSGVDSRFIEMSTYVLTAVSAAVAGIFLTSYLGTAKSDLGSTLTMPIITACVLGGTLNTGGKGTIVGTALAALIVGFLKFGLQMSFHVPQQNMDIPVGLVLLVVVIARAMFTDKKWLKIIRRCCSMRLPSRRS